MDVNIKKKKHIREDSQQDQKKKHLEFTLGRYRHRYFQPRCYLQL